MWVSGLELEKVTELESALVKELVEVRCILK
jgi:hypothetical protein